MMHYLSNLSVNFQSSTPTTSNIILIYHSRLLKTLYFMTSYIMTSYMTSYFMTPYFMASYLMTHISWYMMHAVWCMMHETHSGMHSQWIPMKGHTQGGDATTVLPIERTHMGGTHPQCNPTNRYTYFHRGGTHPQFNPMNGPTYFHRGGDAPTMLPNEWTHTNRNTRTN